MKKSAEQVFKDLAKKILHGIDSRKVDEDFVREHERGNWKGHKPQRRRRSDHA